MRSDTQIYEYVSYFSHILKPMITGKGGGKRYLFHETNIKKFVHMYQNKQLKNIAPTKDSLTLLQIYKSKKIYWIKGYKSICEYVHKYRHILKPIRFGRKTNGRGTFVSEENLEEFVNKYEAGELTRPTSKSKDYINTK